MCGVQGPHSDVQGKRVAGPGGPEGLSDLHQENLLLQRDRDALRLRVGAMQETVQNLNARVSHLLATEVSALLAKSGRCTSAFASPRRASRVLRLLLLLIAGEGAEEIGALIQNYIREVEELR